MKAVILTRVSTKMQEERLSLRAQSKRLEEYAERRELDVIKRFEIIESSTRGERKRFMEMINFCKKQKETIAIVADTVDRVQRSFKESVLLDELMRQDKIELHFYREGMILNSKSTSADIMRTVESGCEINKSPAARKHSAPLAAYSTLPPRQ